MPIEPYDLYWLIVLPYLFNKNLPYDQTNFIFVVCSV